MGPLVVLAYSGGLDTSAIVPWLRERYAARVVCFAADVGQGAGELAGLVEKARRSGAADCVIEDLREEFVRDFVFPTLRAGAVYARSYLLGTAMARAVAGMGLQGSRGPDRLRESARHPGPGDARETLLDRPQPVALLPRGWHPRRSVPGAPRAHLRHDARSARGARSAGRGRDRLRARDACDGGPRPARPRRAA